MSEHTFWCLLATWLRTTCSSVWRVMPTAAMPKSRAMFCKSTSSPITARWSVGVADLSWEFSTPGTTSTRRASVWRTKRSHQGDFRKKWGPWWQHTRHLAGDLTATTLTRRDLYWKDRETTGSNSKLRKWAAKVRWNCGNIFIFYAFRVTKIQHFKYFKYFLQF